MSAQIKFLLFIITLSITPSIVRSQTDNKALNNYFDSVRKGKYIPEPQAVFLTENAEKAILALPTFTVDTTTEVRYKAFRLLNSIAQRSENKSIRADVIQQLIAGCADTDAAIVRQNLSALTSFNLTEFSEAQREKIGELYTQTDVHRPLFAKLIGFLNVQAVKQDLLSQSTQGTQSARWAAMLALARMNDQDAADYVVNKVKSFAVNDDLVYDLLPDMVFIRQRVGFNYLFEVILSDEENCNVANPEAEGKINCAYRTLELVAPYIKGFPVGTDESGDLNVKNYEKALTKSRKWINTHKSD